MRFKASFVLGFGLGYVLGTRAGRERYESIMSGVQKVRDNPRIQSTAGMLQAQAGNAYQSAKGRITPGQHRHEEQWEYDGMARVEG